MSGGWTGSNRRNELPADWAPRIRPTVLLRDAYRCQWSEAGRTCGMRATDVDHIGDKDDHRIENLQALCPWHHRRKTSKQGNEAPNRSRTTEHRHAETHPGLT